MTNHVPTLETCQKLKAAGYPMECEHYWWRQGSNDYSLITKERLQQMRILRSVQDWYSAPILTEILEQLPMSTALARGKYRGRNSYVVCLQQYGGRFVPYKSMAASNFYNPNPAEAAALLFLELKGADHDK